MVVPVILGIAFAIWALGITYRFGWNRGWEERKKFDGQDIAQLSESVKAKTVEIIKLRIELVRLQGKVAIRRMQDPES